MAVGSVLGVGVTTAQAQVLLYSFEGSDSPNSLDGFANNGPGITVSASTIGATNGTGSMELVTTFAAGGFVGALSTAPTQLQTLDNPAFTSVSVDVTVPTTPAFTGTYSDLGITIFVENPPLGEFGEQYQTDFVPDENIDLPAGTSTITIPLQGPDPDYGNDESYAQLLANGFIPTGFEFFIDNNAPDTVYLDNVVLNGVSTVQTSQWTGGNSGSWSNASNWTPSGVPVTGNDVNITSTLGVTQTITYDYTGSAQTLGTLTLDLTGGSGSASEILSMSANNLAAGIENVGFSGAALFNQSGGTNTVGTDLYIANNSGSTGTYTLSGGALQIGGNAYVGGSASGPGGQGVLTVSGTAVLAVTGTLTVYNTGQVNIDGGSTALGNLIVNPGGAVNANAAFTIDYAGNPDPIATIVSYLTDGYNGGWASGEIQSSSVASADSSQSKLKYDIGYADGADGLIPGLSSGQIEILPTLAGDAKLQGNVVFGDFQILAQYFGQSNTTWDEGDFTYNGTTNFGDFQLLAQDFGANSSGLTAGEIASLNGFAAQFGDVLVPNTDGVGFQLISVPEPASAVLLAASGFGLLLARRRGRLRPASQE
ncbi:MAG TPA: PEP-CTERM sorting domain-containing protein [Tepidisphaeraceae bacterium]|nr:PEP-CTERM sorting domain-containing protein [Tepidisphaeraceae bacterium]